MTDVNVAPSFGAGNARSAPTIFVLAEEFKAELFTPESSYRGVEISNSEVSESLPRGEEQEKK